METQDLEKRLDRVEGKIDLMTDRLGSIDTTLAAQHEVLKEHIRRTEILEEDVKPIKAHVAMISGVLKFIGLLVPIAALIVSVFQWLR